MIGDDDNRNGTWSLLACKFYRTELSLSILDKDATLSHISLELVQRRQYIIYAFVHATCDFGSQF